MVTSIFKVEDGSLKSCCSRSGQRESERSLLRYAVFEMHAVTVKFESLGMSN